MELPAPKENIHPLLKKYGRNEDIIVKIKDLQGEVLEVNINTGDTVEMLIEDISSAISINKEQIKLIYRGLELQNEDSLEKYGVIQNCEIHMLKRLKKPIILFYNYKPGENISVKIKLDNIWRFDKVYPKPKSLDSSNLHWEMIFKGNNSLRDPNTNKSYPYLFWEANIIDNTYVNSKLLDNYFCCDSNVIEDFLDDILIQKGLNSLERFDLITFWLPELKSKKFVKFNFLDSEVYDKMSVMEIQPKPKQLIRLILIFISVNNFETSNISLKDIKKIDRHLDEETVVEWGGINLLHIK